MPNWCNNSITISGPTETIKQLWEDATAEGSGLLNAMVPMPKELQETTKGTGDELQIEKYDGFTNWYDWAVARWGTKWDVSTEGLEFEDNGDGTASLSGWFDSAWSPPIGAYEQFTEQNNDCTIEASYFEPGMDFAGFWSTENGDEFCEDLHAEYEKPEENRSDIYKRLDEEYDLSYQFAEWDELNEEYED